MKIHIDGRLHITVPETCKLLDCTSGRVRQLAQAGTITAVKIDERVWLLEERSVKAYARSDRRRGPVAK